MKENLANTAIIPNIIEIIKIFDNSICDLNFPILIKKEKQRTKRDI
jgi:hypothetical protein